MQNFLFNKNSDIFFSKIIRNTEIKEKEKKRR